VCKIAAPLHSNIKGEPDEILKVLLSTSAVFASVFDRHFVVLLSTSMTFSSMRRQDNNNISPLE